MPEDETDALVPARGALVAMILGGAMWVLVLGGAAWTYCH